MNSLFLVKNKKWRKFVERSRCYNPQNKREPSGLSFQELEDWKNIISYFSCGAEWLSHSLFKYIIKLNKKNKNIFIYIPHCIIIHIWKTFENYVWKQVENKGIFQFENNFPFLLRTLWFSNHYQTFVVWENVWFQIIFNLKSNLRVCWVLLTEFFLFVLTVEREKNCGKLFWFILNFYM